MRKDKELTAESIAKEIVEKFNRTIEESDFHIPKFISGVGMGEEGYAEVLDIETNDLAKIQALIAVDEIIEESRKIARIMYEVVDQNPFDKQIIYWREVREEIEKL